MIGKVSGVQFLYFDPDAADVGRFRFFFTINKVSLLSSRDAVSQSEVLKSRMCLGFFRPCVETAHVSNNSKLI